MPNAVEKFLAHAAYEPVVALETVANTTLDELAAVIRERNDCILFGPPGTSKTYMIDHLSERLGEDLALKKIVQFHAGYSYEEFVEGIVPDVSTGGFKYQSGAFLDFCQQAAAQPEEKLCLFIIDEINRANITAVFGEVMNLMDEKGTREIITPKQKIPFSIPKNVVIIGTMNTADKSLAKLDFALRRRFRFLPVYPSATNLHTMVSANGFDQSIPLSVDEYITCFNVLNAKIAKHSLLGKELMLGHVLWTRRNKSTAPYNAADICAIFRECIFPQLENYCGSNRDVLASLLGTHLRDKLVYGYSIADSEVLDFLTGLKNSQVVNS